MPNRSDLLNEVLGAPDYQAAEVHLNNRKNMLKSSYHQNEENQQAAIRPVDPVPPMIPGTPNSNIKGAISGRNNLIISQVLDAPDYQAAARMNDSYRSLQSTDAASSNHGLLNSMSSHRNDKDNKSTRQARIFPPQRPSRSTENKIPSRSNLVIRQVLESPDYQAAARMNDSCKSLQFAELSSSSQHSQNRSDTNLRDVKGPDYEYQSEDDMALVAFQGSAKYMQQSPTKRQQQIADAFEDICDSVLNGSSRKLPDEADAIIQVHDQIGSSANAPPLTDEEQLEAFLEESYQFLTSSGKNRSSVNVPPLSDEENFEAALEESHKNLNRNGRVSFKTLDIGPQYKDQMRTPTTSLVEEEQLEAALENSYRSSMNTGIVRAINETGAGEPRYKDQVQPCPRSSQRNASRDYSAQQLNDEVILEDEEMQPARQGLPSDKASKSDQTMTPETTLLAESARDDSEVNHCDLRDIPTAAVSLYDPNDSNASRLEITHDGKKKARTRYILLVAFTCLVIIGVVVGVTLLLMPEDEHQGKPLSREERISELVQIQIGSQYDLDNSYSKALEWVIYSDPAQLEPTTPTLLQRFVLAYFYFATSVKGSWGNCAPPDYDRSQRNVCHLTSYNNNTLIVHKDSQSTHWLTELHECLWAGVQCDNQDHVLELNLAGMNMTGSFPEGLQFLPFLREVQVADNQLVGALPSTVGNWKHLVSFQGHRNQFSGDGLSSWRKSRNLRVIVLPQNALGGKPLAVKANEWKSLKEIDLSHNLFEGSIPIPLWINKNFKSISLQRNSFTGSIPREITRLTELEVLDLGGNQLKGSLPTELGFLQALVSLDVSRNSITGSIPVNLFRLRQLRNLYLDGNFFNGGVSTEIGQLTNLEVLHLHRNSLKGVLPTELGNLQSLTDVTFYGNYFVEEVPLELCDLRSGEEVRLVTLEADCLALRGQSSEIECSCCTKCCNPSGESCRNL